MQSKGKVIGNGIFLAVVFMLTIYGVFHGEDLGAMMEEFPSLSLEVYHGETEPLKGFYEGKGILVSVANQDTIEGTTRVIMEALGL